MLNPQNSQNVTDGPAFVNSQGKNCPTTQTETQTARVQTDTPFTRTSPGNNSLIKIHVTGPREKAKQAIKSKSINNSNALPV